MKKKYTQINKIIKFFGRNFVINYPLFNQSYE